MRGRELHSPLLLGSTGAETWPLFIAAMTFGVAGLMLLSTRRRVDAA